MNKHSNSGKDIVPEPTSDGKPDEGLHAFLAYLEQERNASIHTLESYRMDIEQFAKAILKSDPAADQVKWDDASVYDARGFVLFLQEEKQEKSSMLRKISALRSFY
ncbi:MAG: site-specific integrase, partial [Lentisphaeria bacterium]|nr:site-specific integrase [Lentisphaeria bacterium]